MRIKSKKPTLRRLPGEPSARSLRLIRMAANLSLVSMLTLWVVLYFWKGAPYDQVWQVLLAHLGTGRAGGVGLGLEQGFTHYYLFVQSCLTDLILILYVYPLFVSGFQHAALWPLVGPWLTKMHAAALKHKGRIAPYGAPGLMLFVVFPFWSTGPIVGVLVGYMLGMRTWVTFSAVIFGDFAAVAAWIWFYDKLKESSNALALAFLALIFALALLGVIYARIMRRKKRALALEEKAETPELPAAEAPETDPASEKTLDAETDEEGPSGEEAPSERETSPERQDTPPKTETAPEAPSKEESAAAPEKAVTEKEDPPPASGDKDDDFLELL